MGTIEILNLVENELRRVERKMREEPHLPDLSSYIAKGDDKGYRYPNLLNEVISQLVSSGGKRVRPALALLVNRIYPAELERIVSLAASVELLHTATLVHDDLIDGAMLRRGNLTLNATWSPGATVLSGDFLFARAADLAAQTDNVRVMRLFAETLMVICSGEIKQMFDKRAGLSRQQYYDRIYAKTAALFAVATEASAILGSAPEPITAALRAYGEQLGMAFQIVDDVLDFISDEDQLGKPAGSDLRAGLITAPTLWFLLQDQEHPLISDILNNGRKDETSIRAAIQTIRDSGAINAALDDAREFIQRSQASLQSLPPGRYRDALGELADFVVERDR